LLNLLPCSYQSQHNPDCCCQQAFGFSVFLLVYCLDFNRKGHYGEDNNIYLNDANLNNTKDLATTLGHETSHAIDNRVLPRFLLLLSAKLPSP
jgi:hypothetical protein